MIIVDEIKRSRLVQALGRSEQRNVYAYRMSVVDDSKIFRATLYVFRFSLIGVCICPMGPYGTHVGRRPESVP